MKLSRNKIDKLLKNRNQSRKNKKARSLYKFTDDELIITKSKGSKALKALKANTMHAKPRHVNLRLKTLKNKVGGTPPYLQKGGPGLDVVGNEVSTQQQTVTEPSVAEIQGPEAVTNGPEAAINPGELTVTDPPPAELTDNSAAELTAVTKTPTETNPLSAQTDTPQVLTDQSALKQPEEIKTLAPEGKKVKIMVKGILDNKADETKNIIDYIKTKEITDDQITKGLVQLKDGTVLSIDSEDTLASLLKNSPSDIIEVTVCTSEYKFWHSILYGDYYYLIDMQYLRNIATYLQEWTGDPTLKDLIVMQQLPLAKKELGENDDEPIDEWDESQDIDGGAMVKYGDTGIEGSPEQVGGFGVGVGALGTGYLFKSAVENKDDTAYVGFPFPDLVPTKEPNIQKFHDKLTNKSPWITTPKEEQAMSDASTKNDATAVQTIENARAITEKPVPTSGINTPPPSETLGNTEEINTNNIGANPGYDSGRPKINPYQDPIEVNQTKSDYLTIDPIDDNDKIGGGPEIPPLAVKAGVKGNTKAEISESVDKVIKEKLKEYEKIKDDDAQLEKRQGYNKDIVSLEVYYNNKLADSPKEFYVRKLLKEDETNKTNYKDLFDQMLQESPSQGFLLREKDINKSRDEAMKLLAECVEDPNTKLRELKGDDILKVKYYLNFIAFSFLNGSPGEEVSMLETKNILKKIGGFYKNITLGDFSKSFEVSASNNYTTRFLSKLRFTSKIKTLNPKASPQELQNYQTAVTNITNKFASYRYKLYPKGAGRDQYEKQKNKILFDIDKIVRHGNFLKLYLKNTEQYLSKLRCREIISTRGFSGRTRNLLKYETARQVLASPRTRFNFFPIVTMPVWGADGKEYNEQAYNILRSLLQSYQTKLRSNDMDSTYVGLRDKKDLQNNNDKILFAFLDNNSNLDTIKSIMASVTQNIVDLARKYMKEIKAQREASKSSKAQKDRAALEKKTSEARDAAKQILEVANDILIMAGESLAELNEDKKNNPDKYKAVVPIVDDKNLVPIGPETKPPETIGPNVQPIVKSTEETPTVVQPSLDKPASSNDNVESNGLDLKDNADAKVETPTVLNVTDPAKVEDVIPTVGGMKNHRKRIKGGAADVASIKLLTDQINEFIPKIDGIVNVDPKKPSWKLKSRITEVGKANNDIIAKTSDYADIKNAEDFNIKAKILVGKAKQLSDEVGNAEKIIAENQEGLLPGQKGPQGRPQGPGYNRGISGADKAVVEGLQKRVALLEAAANKSSEQKALADERADVAAIQAIMVGEDALAHKIKFLVDIPKWQQFKVIGSTENSLEEFAQGMATDSARLNLGKTADELFKLKSKMETEATALKNLLEKAKAKLTQWQGDQGNLELKKEAQLLRTQVSEMQKQLEEIKKKDGKEQTKLLDEEIKVTGDKNTPTGDAVELAALNAALIPYNDTTIKDPKTIETNEEKLQKAISNASLLTGPKSPELIKKIEEAKKAIEDKSKVNAPSGDLNVVKAEPGNDAAAAEAAAKSNKDKDAAAIQPPSDNLSAAIQTTSAAGPGDKDASAAGPGDKDAAAKKDAAITTPLAVVKDPEAVVTDPLAVVTDPLAVEGVTNTKGGKHLVSNGDRLKGKLYKQRGGLPVTGTDPDPGSDPAQIKPTVKKEDLVQVQTVLNDAQEEANNFLKESEVLVQSEETLPVPVTEKSSVVEEAASGAASGAADIKPPETSPKENLNAETDTNAPVTSTKPVTSNPVIKPPPPLTSAETKENNVLAPGQEQEQEQEQVKGGGEKDNKILKNNPKLDKTNENNRPTGYAVYGRNDNKREYYFYKKECERSHANKYVTCDDDLPEYIVNKNSNFYEIKEKTKGKKDYKFKKIGDIVPYDDAYYKSQGYQDIEAEFDENDKSLNEIFFKPGTKQLKDKYEPELLTNNGDILDTILYPIDSIDNAITAHSGNKKRKKAAKEEIAKEKAEAGAKALPTGGSKKHKKTKRKRSRSKKNKKHSKKRKY